MLMQILEADQMQETMQEIMLEVMQEATLKATHQIQDVVNLRNRHTEIRMSFFLYK